MRDGLSRRLAGLILVLAPLVFGGASAAADEPKTVRLLTVGNSFSQNATKYLDDLVKGSGDVLIHHQAAIGGGSLEQHWEKYERHDADPDDPRGLYTTKKSLVEELAAEPWDFVTIQQVSIKSHDASTYRPFAGRLADLIRGRSPHAKLYMHETWAYRRDDPRFAVKSPAPGEPADQEAMHRGLSHAYRLIAGEIGAPIIPVGDAFHLADSDPEWGYRPDPKFDFDDAAFPACPSRRIRCTWDGGGRRNPTASTRWASTATTPTSPASTSAAASSTRRFTGSRSSAIRSAPTESTPITPGFFRNRPIARSPNRGPSTPKPRSRPRPRAEAASGNPVECRSTD